MSKNSKFNERDPEKLSLMYDGGEGDGGAAAPEDNKEDNKADDNKKEDEKKDDKEDDKPKEEKKDPPPAAAKEEEKKDDEESEDEDDPLVDPPIPSSCCCCDCICSTQRTKDATCCGCFPIKCGVVTIGILTWLLATILWIWYFFQFMNNFVHWWATLINLFLLSPFIVAAGFTVGFFTKDSKTTRALMFTGCILVLSSISVVCLWQLCYLIWIYKKDRFYQGYGEPAENMYQSQSKKNFLFILLAESAIVVIAYAYFICVTKAYMNAKHGPEEEKEEGENENSK